MGFYDTGKSTRLKLNPMAYRFLIDALQRGEHNYEQLAEICGLNDRTVRKVIQEFCRPRTGADGDSYRLVHIVYWQRVGPHGCSLKPYFRWGNRPDAPHPPSTTSTERSQRSRQKLKADAPAPWPQTTWIGSNPYSTCAQTP